MKTLTVRSIQVGLPRGVGTDGAPDLTDRPWTTGFFKTPVPGEIGVATTNLDGDGQADLTNHGGPEKAICAYPSEHYPHWIRELGLDLPTGAFGENFTTSGATEPDIFIGDIYEGGTALLQVSQPRQPCWKLARRWKMKTLAALVERTGFTGWYFRVLRTGRAAPGETLRPVERIQTEWSVAAANDIMHHRKSDPAAARALAGCPGLSTTWVASLRRRADGTPVDTRARVLGGDAS